MNVQVLKKIIIIFTLLYTFFNYLQSNLIHFYEITIYLNNVYE